MTDNFDVSDGNIAVLVNIPHMMNSPKYRKELRKLTIEFLQDKEEK